jgi:CBS domain-containing protein
MNAQDIMTSEHLWVCSPETTVRQCAQMMNEHEIGALPVVDSAGRTTGIITDRDICCRVVAQARSYETPIQDVMSTPVHTVNTLADLNEIEDLMKEYQVRRLPVVDDQQRIVGMISLGDLARRCRSFFREHGVVETLEAVSSREVLMERI